MLRKGSAGTQGPRLSLAAYIQWLFLKVASAPRQATWEAQEQKSYKSILAEFRWGAQGQASSHGPISPVHHYGTGRGQSKARISLAPSRRDQGLADVPKMVGWAECPVRLGHVSPGPGGRNFLKGFYRDRVKGGSKGPWQSP